MNLPTGTFALGEDLNFSMTYDENVVVAGGNPFLVLDIDGRIRLAQMESSSDAVINYKYTVQNSDFDNNGIGITATTGLSKTVFEIPNNLSPGNTIQISSAGNYTVENGKTSAEQVATALREHLNSDSTFSKNLTAVGLGSGKIAIVGTNSATMSVPSGSLTALSSGDYITSNATIKDLYGNDANASFSLKGSPTNININGGAAGVGVDGYLDDVVIVADHDLSGDLTFGDFVTSSDSTGVFTIFGGLSPLSMYGGTDISTGNTFDVQYEAPAGYSVINPISSVIRSSEILSQKQGQPVNTSSAENKIAEAIFGNNSTTVDFKTFNPYSSVSNVDEITAAISYQKAAASLALVVDLASAGIVELSKEITIAFEQAANVYDVSSDKASENASLNLDAGKVAILGNDTDGYKLQKLKIGSDGNLKADGDSISFTDNKTAFDALNITAEQNKFTPEAITTRKASELVFDAIAKAIDNGDPNTANIISPGNLNTLGATSTDPASISSQVTKVLEDTVKDIFGPSTYVSENLEAKLSNAAQVLATGIERINTISADTTTSEGAIAGLTQIVQTQSVWQGDARSALADNDSNNDWLSFGGTNEGIVDFFPVNGSGDAITKDANETTGYPQLQGYKLTVNGDVLDPSTHKIDWYTVTFNPSGSDTINDNSISEANYPATDLQGKYSNGLWQNLLNGADGITFKITEIASGNVIMGSGTNPPAPVIDPNVDGTRGPFQNLVINDVASNVFEWGGIADNATVGVVVPTRFSISASEEQREQFEGSSLDADGDGNKDGTEFLFTIQREGNESISVDIDYEVIANTTLTADDFDGGVLPSGTLIFGPDEKSKTLTIRLNNDEIKEGKESFNVKLVDKYNTAQILEGEVSRSILDDDPTNPQLSNSNLERIDIVAGKESTTPINIGLDYFDQSSSASFTITTKNNAGSILFDGQSPEGQSYSFVQLKNALSKISFTGTLDEASGSSKITVTDTDRGNTGDTTLLFNIHNPPKISLPTDQINFEAGKSSNFSGISVFDVDTDEVFVTLSVEGSCWIFGGFISRRSCYQSRI